MYTKLKSYQIIISLLKQYNIKHLVLSAGTRNIPFVQSVENDPFFKCYSVVDERSAAYMAIGLSTHLNEPVVISCTSSTATCNYFPAIAEAFHQNIPLIVLTSDRNPALLGQREDQMINQVNMYGSFVRRAVNLPVVNTDEDQWFCNRLVNEALMTATAIQPGPVQINIPMLTYATTCPEKECLIAHKIDYVSTESSEELWAKMGKRLNGFHRIMIVCGQNNSVSKHLDNLISKFTLLYKNVVLGEYMSNVHGGNIINPFLPFETHLMDSTTFEQYKPDLVISFGGNLMSGIKSQLRSKAGTYEHWDIEVDGSIVDMYKSLAVVFHCSAEYFFEKFIGMYDPNIVHDESYSNLIKEYCDSIRIPELSFSNNTIIRDFSARIPEKSILHLSINNSIRLVNFFGLRHADIKVYANIGTHGIDGCLSSFIGQAIANEYKNPEALNFLVIGDLSFFYDMGALRIKHLPKSSRILLVNNFGGGEFHYSTTLKDDPTMDLHTSAAHSNKAQGWVESLGIKYLAAKNDEEYQKALNEFFKPCDTPVLIEVFSDMEVDATATRYLETSNKKITKSEVIKGIKSEVIQSVKNTVKNIVGDELIDKVKEIMKK